MPANPDADIIHKGGCFCNAVRYQVMGLPLLSAYCHCTLCQRLNAAAFILTIHFPASRFSWTHPEPYNDALESYAVSTKPWKIRWRCKQCGCTVSSYNSKLDKWSVWGAQLERDVEGRIKDWDTIKPTAHVFYETRMVDVQDDLGKWAGYEGKSEKRLELVQDTSTTYISAIKPCHPFVHLRGLPTIPPSHPAPVSSQLRTATWTKTLRWMPLRFLLFGRKTVLHLSHQKRTLSISRNALRQRPAYRRTH